MFKFTHIKFESMVIFHLFYYYSEYTKKKPIHGKNDILRLQIASLQHRVALVRNCISVQRRVELNDQRRCQNIDTGPFFERRQF